MIDKQHTLQVFLSILFIQSFGSSPKAKGTNRIQAQITCGETTITSELDSNSPIIPQLLAGQPIHAPWVTTQVYLGDSRVPLGVTDIIIGPLAKLRSLSFHIEYSIEPARWFRSNNLLNIMLASKCNERGRNMAIKARNLIERSREQEAKYCFLKAFLSSHSSEDWNPMDDYINHMSIENPEALQAIALMWETVPLAMQPTEDLIETWFNMFRFFAKLPKLDPRDLATLMDNLSRAAVQPIGLAEYLRQSLHELGSHKFKSGFRRLSKYYISER